MAEIQSGLDGRDADVYRRFAHDVMWGTPFGATIAGYAQIHPIHARLLERDVARPGSRYEVVHAQPVTDDVMVADVRRTEPVAGDPTGDRYRFEEMALYVLSRRKGEW